MLKDPCKAAGALSWSEYLANTADRGRVLCSEKECQDLEDLHWTQFCDNNLAWISASTCSCSDRRQEMQDWTALAYNMHWAPECAKATEKRILIILTSQYYLCCFYIESQSKNLETQLSKVWIQKNPARAELIISVVNACCPTCHKHRNWSTQCSNYFSTSQEGRIAWTLQCCLLQSIAVSFNKLFAWKECSLGNSIYCILQSKAPIVPSRKAWLYSFLWAHACGMDPPLHRHPPAQIHAFRHILP